MNGADQLGAALFAVLWGVILWTRHDLKGLSKKLGRAESKRRALVATIVEATDDPEKRKMFTSYLRRED